MWTLVVFTFFAVANVSAATPVVTTLNFFEEKACKDAAAELTFEANIGGVTGNGYRVVAKCVHGTTEGLSSSP
jgi:hypothetical protein